MEKEVLAELDLIADPLEDADATSLMGPECAIDSSSSSSSGGCGHVWNCAATPL
ncbi:hypothetical protein ACFC00_36595 [Streptomyces adustus]|uniref:hypothetical protein n=1 Tax=Streptomyces adustus TaxID=1609272 RepID=UPI0035DC8BDA